MTGAAGRNVRPFLAAALLLAHSAQAQPSGRGPGAAVGGVVEQQVLLVEQALEQAVSRGVTAVEQRFPSVPPGLLFFAGSIRARGFVLDDYGLFFDVEHPVVRRSIVWSMRVLDRLDADRAHALAGVRRRMLARPDVPGRAVRRAAEQRARMASADPVPAASADRPAIPPGGAPPVPQAADPEALYRAALANALTDALIRYGGSMQAGALGGVEWVTVAARDGRGLGVRPGDRRTLQIRVRGDDLTALRGGRISPEEAQARIETR